MIKKSKVMVKSKGEIVTQCIQAARHRLHLCRFADHPACKNFGRSKSAGRNAADVDSL
jgi:hypothetical protein